MGRVLRLSRPAKIREGVRAAVAGDGGWGMPRAQQASGQSVEFGWR